MVVWVSGCSCYETTGVITLLNDRGIVARDFRAGRCFCAGDTLILCLSSAPLLGWCRYLKTARWIAGRYDIRLIVLCPEVVYRSGVVCGRNMVAVNGESELFQLIQALTQTVLNNFQKGDNAYSALFDHGLASKPDQRFASIRSTGNLTFSTAF